MKASESISIRNVVRDDKKVIYLTGAIDEDSKFDDILRNGSPYLFNFKDISSINSLGVRNWVNFIKSLGQSEIYYEECPPVIVRQLNMIPSFVANARILSVYLPYICDSCEIEKLVLVDQSEFMDTLSVSESIPCNQCKKDKMVPDVKPEQYFAFRG